MQRDSTTTADLTHELLHRVASSPPFQKAKRLRDLLLYIGERALKDPNCILREQEIGVEVLGRQPDYDTSHDTLVRVQISQLRKKLQEYFATEGRNEPTVIEIPKGSYVPIFRPRSQRDAEPNSNGDSHKYGESGPVESTTSTRNKIYALTAGCVILLATVVALSWKVYTAGNAVRGSQRPTVDAFWRQLFDNGQPTNVVLSDITLIPFEKLMGQGIPLSEYESKEFERLADQRLKDPVRSLAKEVVNRVATSVSDVEAAREFGVLASENHLPLVLISARDLSSEQMASQNSILLGSWRADPWVGLFESQMNFRTEYQEIPPSVQFINTAPRKDEESSYKAEWRHHGYCRVTFLSNPKGTGNVLLISGTDVISTEAGGRFLTTESMLRDLRQKLGLRVTEPFPHFELLLRTEIVNNTVPRFEVVAYRPHSQ